MVSESFLMNFKDSIYLGTLDMVVSTRASIVFVKQGLKIIVQLERFAIGLMQYT